MQLGIINNRPLQIIVGAVIFIGAIWDGFSTVRSIVLWVVSQIDLTVFVWLGVSLTLGVGGYVFGRGQRPKEGSDIHHVTNSGALFRKFRMQLAHASDEVIVVNVDQDWVFMLIVTLALARRKDVPVTVLYFGHEHERYNLLKLLGCKVRRTSPDDDIARMSGIFSDALNPRMAKATMKVTRSSEIDGFSARHYCAPNDFSMICSARKYLEKYVDGDTLKSSGFVPRIVEVSDEEIIEAVKQTPLYKSARVQFEELKIASMIPTSKYVIRFKYEQASDLIDFYQSKDWLLFRPCGIYLANDKVSYMVPPVVEQHGRKQFVVEGHSRLLALRNRGVEKAKVIVVTDVSAKLATSSTKWRTVRLSDEKVEQRDSTLARYIESSTHKGIWSAKEEK